jgi:hypothetical protein
VTAHHAAFFQIALMVLLRLPEVGRGDDLRHDRLAIGAGSRELGNSGSGGEGLLVRVRKEPSDTVSPSPDPRG